MRNATNIAMTVEERSKLAYEWTISDLMDDERQRLQRMLDRGVICRDEYYDGLDRLRETAEETYKHEFSQVEEEQDWAEESDWDNLQEYMEAF